MGKREGKGRRRKDRRGKKRKKGLDVSGCVKCHFENVSKDKGREEAAQMRLRQGGEEESDGQSSRTLMNGAETETSPFECVQLDLFVSHI